MQEINVCSNGFNGNRNETITFKNPHSGDVVVKQCDASTWPFATPSSPFTVSTKSTQNATLIGTCGTYTYCTAGCPGDHTLVNPKNVIIT